MTWANWKAFERRMAGFIEWAEPAPADSSEARYAIVCDGAIAWARVSPNPDARIDISSGRFYDTGDPNDHPEGAIEWARAAAQKDKERLRRLLSPCVTPTGRTDSHGTYVRRIDGVMCCDFCKRPV